MGRVNRAGGLRSLSAKRRSAVFVRSSGKVPESVKHEYRIRFGSNVFLFADTLVEAKEIVDFFSGQLSIPVEIAIDRRVVVLKDWEPVTDAD